MATLDFPAWFYRGQEAVLVPAGEEIPHGWLDHPTDFNGADPAKFDHDQDGYAGGSLPIKRGPGRPRKNPL